MPSRQNVASKPVQVLADQRADGRLKKRPPLQPLKRNSIDAGAALCFGDGRSVGMLAGRKDATRKLYRDAYEAFRRFVADSGVDPRVDGWSRLPPNALAAFYRRSLDHRRGNLSERTASSYAYAISALLRQLLIEERLPASVSLEKLRLGLREALAHGDYHRRKVDPRIDAFVAWVVAQPTPPIDDIRVFAHLEALRARALILALYCSGLRREEVTALETAEVLGGAQPGEADVRGKGDRERTVFLDATALDAIRAYVNARGPGDTRRWVFVSHGNRRRRNDRLSPWSVWSIVKNLARRAEIADPRFIGLSRTLHTHDTRHHFARTVLNAGAGLSVVQDLLGHASPATTKRIYATSDREVLRSAASAHAPRLEHGPPELPAIVTSSNRQRRR
jgi:integrase